MSREGLRSRKAGDGNGGNNDTHHSGDGELVDMAIVRGMSAAGQVGIVVAGHAYDFTEFLNDQ